MSRSDSFFGSDLALSFYYHKFYFIMKMIKNAERELFAALLTGIFTLGTLSVAEACAIFCGSDGTIGCASEDCSQITDTSMFCGPVMVICRDNDEP